MTRGLNISTMRYAFSNITSLLGKAIDSAEGARIKENLNSNIENSELHGDSELEKTLYGGTGSVQLHESALN